jgi:hypothetical protein
MADQIIKNQLIQGMRCQRKNLNSNDDIGSATTASDSSIQQVSVPLLEALNSVSGSCGMQQDQERIGEIKAIS